MGNEQPMRKISHSEMAQAIENVDQRIITAIKVERWIAAICEFKNLFYCTAEDLRELRMANAGNFAELTMEEKAMQQAMHDKLDMGRVHPEQYPEGHRPPGKATACSPEASLRW